MKRVVKNILLARYDIYYLVIYSWVYQGNNFTHRTLAN
jgi:hypothetical protein